eukprot:1157528-Pelagomonas_calceolata.AAC.6
MEFVWKGVKFWKNGRAAAERAGKPLTKPIATGRPAVNVELQEQQHLHLWPASNGERCPNRRCIRSTE